MFYVTMYFSAAPTVADKHIKAPVIHTVAKHINVGVFDF